MIYRERVGIAGTRHHHAADTRDRLIGDEAPVDECLQVGADHEQLERVRHSVVSSVPVRIEVGGNRQDHSRCDAGFEWLDAAGEQGRLAGGRT